MVKIGKPSFGRYIGKKRKGRTYAAPVLVVDSLTGVAQIQYDRINPNHYKSESEMQAIDVIEIFHLDFPLGTAVKYILREGKKPDADAITDLEKAIWYLQRKIGQLKRTYPSNWQVSEGGHTTLSSSPRKKLSNTPSRANGITSSARSNTSRRR